HLASDESMPGQKLLRSRRGPDRSLHGGGGALLDQRPAALGGRRKRAPTPEDMPSGPDAAAAPPERRRGVPPEHAEGVVGHQALPDQVPERFQRFLREPSARGLVQRGEEARAPRPQRLQSFPGTLGEWLDVEARPGWTKQAGKMVRQV